MTARNVEIVGVIGATIEDLLDFMAKAWDEGYSTALGDFDIAARAEARSENPHRIAKERCCPRCHELRDSYSEWCEHCNWSPAEDGEPGITPVSERDQ